MRLVSPTVALEALLSVAVTNGISTQRVAEILAVPPSDAERALGVLLADRLIVSAGPPHVHCLSDAPEVGPLLALAAAHLPRDRALSIALRAGDAVEAAAVDDSSAVVVAVNRGALAASGRLAGVLDAVGRRHALELSVLARGEARAEELFPARGRPRVGGMRILHGTDAVRQTPSRRVPPRRRRRIGRLALAIERDIESLSTVEAEPVDLELLGRDEPRRPAALSQVPVSVR